MAREADGDASRLSAGRTVQGEGRSATIAPSLAAPIKRGRGRPPKITDMKAYKREKAKQYRAAAKLKADGKAK
jgi:hypothetical protein